MIEHNKNADQEYIFKTDMNNNVILSSAVFKKLLRYRNVARFSLSIMVFVCHAFFVGGIAFYQDFFARPVSSGATITVGIVCAVLVLLAMMVLEFIYIVVSEKILDPLQQDIHVENEPDV